MYVHHKTLPVSDLLLKTWQASAQAFVNTPKKDPACRFNTPHCFGSSGIKYVPGSLPKTGNEEFLEAQR